MRIALKKKKIPADVIEKIMSYKNEGWSYSVAIKKAGYTERSLKIWAARDEAIAGLLEKMKARKKIFVEDQKEEDEPPILLRTSDCDLVLPAGIGNWK